jgi:hypothetical protein
MPADILVTGVWPYLPRAARYSSGLYGELLDDLKTRVRAA